MRVETTATLPAADDGRMSEGLPMASLGPCRRVLIVEDVADVADSLAILLGLWGYRVDVARSGHEGLAAAIATKPDTILLDIRMPGMDGCEVASRLRATRDFDDVPIIAITGYGMESDRRRTAAAGINHHLVKPVTAEELKQLLRATTRIF
jgi:CheY-like chemotaxis protein